MLYIYTDLTCVRMLVEAGNEEAVAPAEIKSTDTSVIIYTSGTTGQPKGVPLQHRNIVAVISGSRPFFAVCIVLSDPFSKPW